MTWTIRRATGEAADLAAVATIVGAVTPDKPTSIDAMRWADSTYPGGARFLAEDGGDPVGAATVGRIYMYPADYNALWATIDVVRTHRRRGIGSALLDAVRGHARSAGKTALHVPASEARPEGVAFLAHRGFAEIERAKAVRLDLGGLTAPTVDPPPGVRITSLAERPDLVADVHAVAIEAFADIPGGDRPPDPGSIDDFRARDVDRGAIPPGGFIIALDDATNAVIGYASLLFKPGSTTVAWHDMTAVRRAWRRRGVAASMKRAAIAWAVANGLEALETHNDEANASMRAVNVALGYRPLPDVVTMRGELHHGIMAE
jgi:GNAT superfamily N-acetyltransferase